MYYEPIATPLPLFGYKTVPLIFLFGFLGCAFLHQVAAMANQNDIPQELLKSLSPLKSDHFQLPCYKRVCYKQTYSQE